MAQERLNQRPAVEEWETQQQNPVAAAGGDVPDVGGTPVPAAPPKAPATSLTRQYLGFAEDWWYKIRSSTTPRAQVQNTDPGRAVDAKAEPSLGGTPAAAMSSSQTDARSQLDPRFRMNLQALIGTRKAKDPAPLGTEASRDRGERPPTPPIPGVLPAPMSMSEQPMNLVAMAWYKTLKSMIDLTTYQRDALTD